MNWAVPGVPDAAAGRFAPTPSGDLHIGNLRTAMLSWLFARWGGRQLLFRVDDLDPQRSRPSAIAGQWRDLAAVGVTFDNKLPAAVHESTRAPVYAEAIENLRSRGLVYECFCTRREILEAPTASHSAPGAYPGTCRYLTESERADRRRDRRHPALRLRAQESTFVATDILHGRYEGVVDDFVLARGDGTAAYNLAVVVDDAAQHIDQVVRGDDLLASAPRQAYLAGLLGYRAPTYAHVGLVVGRRGERLAKRDGAVTLAELASRGIDAERVAGALLASLSLPATLEQAVSVFDPEALPRTPWVFDAADLAS